jgi:hypothetical protein
MSLDNDLAFTGSVLGDSQCLEFRRCLAFWPSPVELGSLCTRLRPCFGRSVLLHSRFLAKYEYVADNKAVFCALWVRTT